MKNIVSSFLQLFFVLLLLNDNKANAQNVLIAGWDVSSINATQLNNLGPQNFAATASATNVVAGGLMRTANVGSATGNLFAGWGGFGFCGTATDPIPNTLANVIGNNAFAYFTLKADTGHTLSLDSFTIYFYSAANYGPRQLTLQYGIDSLNFTNIYTNVLTPNTGVIGNLVNFSLNLGNIAALQNVAYTHTIYFRLVPVYSGTATTILPVTAPSAGAGVWAIYNSNTNASFNAGCDMFFKGTVGIGCSPIAPGTISSNIGNQICGNGNAVLSLNGNAPINGVNYQWKSSTNGTTWINAGTNTPTLNTGVITATTYYKCIETCVSGTVADSTPVFTLTVNPVVTPTINISAAPGTNINPGQTVTFTATATNAGTGATYEWKKNGTNIPGAPTTNTYTTNQLSDGDVISCMLHSATVCSVPDSVWSNPLLVTINNCLPPAGLTMWNLSANGTEFVWNPVNGATGYEYIFDQQSTIINASGITTVDTFHRENNKSGTWYFHIRTVCNSSNQSPWITIPVVFSTTGILLNGKEANNVTIYPNPNTGNFTLEGTIQGKDAQIEIMNTIGQMIYRQKLQPINNTIKETISLPENLTNGTYLLQLSTTDGANTIRFQPIR
ncbi:T9SS type A sorting domain-containing protein [Taibaiella soli]|nr:T9SS type A sorting domain-containing protein [Taibaiella soli]